MARLGLVRLVGGVDSVVGDVVTIRGTVAQMNGTVLRVFRESLRFLSVADLNRFLAEAGFEIEEQYGAWSREPVTASSREIITIARRG